MSRHCFAVVAGLLLTGTAGAAESFDFFEKKIRPVLVEKCYSCHSADAKKVRGGLLLDTRDGLRKGGDTGPSVVPGDAAKSLILKALRYQDGLDMPPSGRLPDAVAKDFEQWIKDGAADPRDGATANTNAIDFAKAKQFWAFQPPKSHPAPFVRDASWPRRPIDAFVLAKLEAANLTPSPAADREAFVRRLTFDLTALPPKPEHVDEYLHDDSPDADARLVELLLQSPGYGERWGRVWLDVARYGEDQAHIVGNDQSLTYPNAYLYRDWVIAALNADMPFDRFVRLQLAADQLEGDDSPNLAATGFVGLGPKYYDRGRLAVMAEEWEDRVDTVGRGLLGLTVACARCHDHKFDPIPTGDYYSLAGVFSSTNMHNKPLPGVKADKEKSPANAMHVVAEGKVADLNVFVRGNVESEGPIAPRRFLRVLSDGEPKPFAKGSGRLELADAIASPSNPLTARVIVNRVWAQYFGRGIVGTPGNFGALGERPVAPELLDDLAVRFMGNGWSLKWLHREIALSATYRQRAEPEVAFGRVPRRRLPVESWRDALLSASGKLDASRVGGKSIDPSDPSQARRTVYAKISRLEVNAILAMFDYPDPNGTADRRVETTTPLQKLFALNSPFMTTLAEAFVERLRRDVPAGDEARVQRAYQLLFGRPATSEEIDIGLRFLASGGDPVSRWKQYAHALLASNEVMYLD